VGAVASYESGALFIVIYIWVGVFSVLAPSQVWTLANYVLTTREAKRSFGFIGSGAILGGSLAASRRARPCRSSAPRACSASWRSRSSCAPASSS
jgi:hypothetical protein